MATLLESNANKMVKGVNRIGIIWPEEGAPASVRYAAISYKIDQEKVAEAFINFILEYETQEQMVVTGVKGYYTSSVQDVKSPTDRHAEAPLLLADPVTVANNEAEVKTWFADQSVQ